MQIPNSVSVITRQRIEDQNLNTVEEALEQVTGVTVTPWDGATSQIRSRGYFLESSYDGVPAFGGLNATQQYDLAMFDRVEVLRGPAGLFQGSGQPGGTVNFVRKRAPFEPQGNAALMYGSWDNKRTELDIGAPLDAAGDLRGRIVVSAQDREFFYDNADAQTYFFYGTLDYDLAPSTTVSLYAATQDSKTNPFSGLPAYTDGRLLDVSRSTNPTPSWTSFDTRLTTFGLEGAHDLSNGWTLKALVGHSRSDWYLNDAYPSTGVDPDTGNIGRYTRRGWDDESRRESLDIFATGPFTLLGRDHEATLGFNYERYSGETLYGANSTVEDIPLGQPDLVPENSVQPYNMGWEYETEQQGIYSQLRLSPIERFTVVMGGRLSNFTDAGRYVLPSTPTEWATSGRERNTFTPSGGLIYQINPQLVAYTSYADIFMPQSQANANGEALEPRVGKQIELGIKGQFNETQLQYSAAIFRTQDVNRAYRDLDNPGSFLAAGEVVVEGAEVEISGSPMANVNLTAGYTYLTSQYEVDQNRSGEQFSLFEPKHSLKLYGTYRPGGSPWRISTGMVANSAIDGTGEEGIREGSGYAILNAQLGYDVTSDTSLTLAINNLTDRRYYARIGGLNSYNTYGDPLNVAVNLRTSF
ncbi:TonB-dependent siderophore receptor [Halomonas sp. AOP12-B1-6]